MRKYIVGVVALITLIGLATSFDDNWDFDTNWNSIEVDTHFEWNSDYEDEEKSKHDMDLNFDNDWKMDWDSTWKNDWQSDQDKEKKYDKEPKDKKEPKDDKKQPKEEPDETVYWQVDFAEGELPIPPYYHPRDLMAALGNSEDGSTSNPDTFRQNNQGELAEVEIVDNQFHFDDEDNPSEATVKFELEEDAEARELHLASFVLPGPFDYDEVDEQELFEVQTQTFEGGESGELTVELPTN